MRALNPGPYLCEPSAYTLMLKPNVELHNFIFRIERGLFSKGLDRVAASTMAQMYPLVLQAALCSAAFRRVSNAAHKVQVTLPILVKHTAAR